MREDKFKENEYEKCRASVDYSLSTNPKFKSFNQLYYHPGDWEDIKRYAYLHVRSLFHNKSTIFNKKELKNNIFNENDIPYYKLYDKINFTILHDSINICLINSKKVFL